jgi:hypothetical protein
VYNHIYNCPLDSVFVRYRGLIICSRATGTNLEHNCTGKEFRCEFWDCVHLCVSHPAIQHAADADDHAAACMHACMHAGAVDSFWHLGPPRTPSWRWPWTPCCWADGFSTPHATAGRSSGALRFIASKTRAKHRHLAFPANDRFPSVAQSRSSN